MHFVYAPRWHSIPLGPVKNDSTPEQDELTNDSKSKPLIVGWFPQQLL
jgi:hypothetical protein